MDVPARKKKQGSRAPAEDAAAEGVAPDEVGGEGGPEVGANLRRIRAARAISLDTLARSSGVSRAMLSQIELGRSTPTIKVLWKIARALDLPFSALISGARPEPSRTRVMLAERARRLTSHDGRFSSRALFPADQPRRLEFYELRLARGGLEEAEPHAPGTVENLVVHGGTVELRVAGEAHRLGPGDAILFHADVPHAYRNAGTTEAVMYLVIGYADAVSAPPGWSV